MKPYVRTHLTVPIDHPSIYALKDATTKINPEWQQNERLGFSNFNVPRFIKAYVESPLHGVVHFPRNLRHRFLPDAEDRTSPGLYAYLGREIKLRPEQVEPVAKMVEYLKRFGGGTLKAAPGAGKTVASLEIARRLGRKTAVLVHQEFLLNQWRDRIAQFLGIEAGIVQQDTFEADKPIVICMAQTINSRDFPQEFYDSFGLVICDETHRFSASTFAEAVVKFPARYRLGVTATPKRADGLEWIFYGHIGPVSVTMDVKMEKPTVYVIRSPVLYVSEDALKRRGKPDLNKTLDLLISHPDRNSIIVNHALEAAIKGRKVIVFSDRRKHLETLGKLFKETAASRGQNITFGFYVGNMTEAERDISSKQQVIFATYAFAKEGLDIPELSVCIFATPKGDIIQAVGRIQRVMEKPKPIVIDIYDDAIDLCRGLYRKRVRQYEREKWPIKLLV